MVSRLGVLVAVPALVLAGSLGAQQSTPSPHGALKMACATCHDVYRDVQVDGKPAGLEARCNPKG